MGGEDSLDPVGLWMTFTTAAGWIFTAVSAKVLSASPHIA